MHRALSTIFILVGFSLLPGFTCSGPFMLPVDSCTAATPGQVDSIDIGGSDDDASFMQLSDNAMVDLAIGGQGFHMVGLRLRLHGANIPSCLTVDATITGNLGGDESPTVKTYPQSDGTSLTKAIWIPLHPDDGGAMELATFTAAGATSMLHLQFR